MGILYGANVGGLSSIEKYALHTELYGVVQKRIGLVIWESSQRTLIGSLRKMYGARSSVEKYGSGILIWESSQRTSIGIQRKMYGANP